MTWQGVKASCRERTRLLRLEVVDLGVFELTVITGSGNAAAFAFNEAVTPFAPEFGMKIEDLGFIACISATLGRVSSPLGSRHPHCGHRRRQSP